jgi:hypothetical protein
MHLLYEAKVSHTWCTENKHLNNFLEATEAGIVSQSYESQQEVEKFCLDIQTEQQHYFNWLGPGVSGC